MPALPRNSRELGFAGRRMTAAEFLSLGETTERLELIDGVVVMSPSPFPIHQRFVDEIQGQFAFARRGGLAIVVFPDTDIEFGPDLVYRPDLAIYRAERMPKTPDRLAIVPDLIIEILSTGTKGTDLITKRDDYERCGVGEYWTIDPKDMRTRCWKRQGSVLTETPAATDVLVSALIPGLAVELQPLRQVC
jgi:Uma2 family endonuclease